MHNPKRRTPSAYALDNEALTSRETPCIKPKILDDGVVGSMFRRRKGGNTEEGNVCPYCKFVNEDAVESCAQCYYSMNLAARDQPMATPSTSGSDLLDTLMGDTELEEEEMTVEAVLSLEDVSVEVDPYEEVKQEDKDEFQFISGSSPTLSKTVEFETPDEVELDVSDAPANPVVFDMGDADPLGVPMEPVPIGLGKLYSPSVKTEKDDDLMGSIGPVAGQTTATPEIPDFTNLTQVKQKSPSEPVQETPQVAIPSPVASSPEPAVSEVPIVPVTPEVPNLNSAPSTPELPTVAEHTQAPPTPDIPENFDPAPVATTPELPTTADVTQVIAETEQSAPATPQTETRMWPWPAREPWDAHQVYREVVSILDSIKLGELSKAAETLDALGPHLEHNFDMMLHIGSAMRALNREEHLQWTLAMAKYVHPNNEQVAAAVSQLS
tara:strand:+ start:1252 stop:2568 length:1317 start_codon:yes stop_codon:yes gene_type:complete